MKNMGSFMRFMVMTKRMLKDGRNFFSRKVSSDVIMNNPIYIQNALKIIFLI